MPPCQVAGVLDATVPGCQSAGMPDATVPGGWDAGYHCAGCQDAETPQCHVSCAIGSLRAWGSVVVPGRTLTPSPCLHRLCLPHLLRPRLRTEGTECPARAEDAARGKWHQEVGVSWGRGW